MTALTHFADVPTPKPRQEWAELPEAEKIKRIQECLNIKNNKLFNSIQIAAAKSDGQVIVMLREPLSADKRGGVLLDLEELLKMALDEGITVWLEALGDKSSLRNLRGIEVKA